jgi:hypothetical protein
MERQKEIVRIDRRFENFTAEVAENATFQAVAASCRRR